MIIYNIAGKDIATPSNDHLMVERHAGLIELFDSGLWIIRFDLVQLTDSRKMNEIDIYLICILYKLTDILFNC